ncbi:MAG: cytidylyltransferase domain-containing protein [Bacillota bacterium]
MNILALIPARGGSKGIKKKNIVDLNGKPLISYTIEVALKSKYINAENIWCSTDDEKIAEVAKEYGAQIPFIRPHKFAEDESSSASVAIHALDWARNNNITFDYLMLLQPTSPLRTAEDIDSAIEIMKNKKADSVISLTEPDILPFHMKYLNDDGTIENYTKEEFNRRQDMPEIYGTNGAIYIVKPEILYNQNSFIGDKNYGYVMNKEKSVDIDSNYDLKIARLLIKDRDNKRDNSE